MQASNGKTEIVVSEDQFSVERLPVPGGWLYISRIWSPNGGGWDVAVASTFVPDVEKP